MRKPNGCADSLISRCLLAAPGHRQPMLAFYRETPSPWDTMISPVAPGWERGSGLTPDRHVTSCTMAIGAPKDLTDCRRFFTEPATPRQRQYEALRSYFLEQHPSAEVVIAEHEITIWWPFASSNSSTHPSVRPILPHGNPGL